MPDYQQLQTYQLLRAPRFWRPCGPLCVKFVFYAILEFRFPRQIFRKGSLYYTHAIQKLYFLKAPI